MRLVLDLPTGRGEDLQVGASVCVAGVCLTAVEIDGDTVAFDVIDETLARTSLGGLRAGRAVNVERAARFGDEIGGHSVSGHVWGMAKVTEVERSEANLRVRMLPPDDLRKYIFEKGYIGLDGASLTIGAVQPDGAFDVHLIPETTRLTTFDRVQPGSPVNVEIDAQTQAVVDTVERVLAQRARG
jgi:riboflavin synthase